METWNLNYAVYIQIVTPFFGGDYDMPGTAKHTHTQEREREISGKSSVFCNTWNLNYSSHLAPCVHI